MNQTNYYIEVADWNLHQEELKLIRTEVFVIEQKVPPEEEWDELDACSIHVITRDSENKAIGTARLTPEGKIGRMAVLANYRRQKVGEGMLTFLLEQAKAQGLTEVFLHAQTSALAFYQKSGFCSEGDIFYEANIPHRFMRLSLNPEASKTSVSKQHDGTELIIIESLETARTFIDQLVQSAEHALCIYTHDLDALLTNRESFIEGCRRIALSGRNAEIRVLIRDPQTAARSDHRLLRLASRLPSTLSLRTPTNPDDRAYLPAFMLNDTEAYFFRPNGARHEGKAQLLGHTRHAELLNHFNEVWDRAEPTPELRNMTL
jgi:predicted GNAT family N-acyltransferase